MDARHRYMATFVGDAFGKGCPPASIDAVISEHMELLNNFLTPAGPRTIYMMFQQELREGAGGELTPYGGKVLTIDTQLKPLVDDNAKAVYFIRVTDSKDGVSAKTPELDLCAGEVNSQGLECFQTTLQARRHPARHTRRPNRRAIALHADRAAACRSCSCRCWRRCSRGCGARRRSRPSTTWWAS